MGFCAGLMSWGLTVVIPHGAVELHGVGFGSGAYLVQGGRFGVGWGCVGSGVCGVEGGVLGVWGAGCEVWL